MEYTCFVDVGIGSNISISALFVILHSITDNWQIFAFHKNLIGPINEMDCIQLQNEKEESNIDECFIQAYDKKLENQVLFITEHHLNIFSQVGLLLNYYCPNWIIISGRSQRNEIFVENIKAQNIYFGENTNELLQLMIENKILNDKMNGFEGKVIISEQCLANPYLTIVIEKGIDITDFKWEKSDPKEDKRDKYKKIKNQIKTVPISYKSPTIIEAQLITSMGFRNCFTQNQNDLFALQCCFYINQCLKNQKSGLSEWMLITMENQYDQILLYCYQQSKRCKLLLECRIQSISHLFAFLFAVKNSNPKHITQIPDKAFGKYIVFETCRKMKQLQNFTETLKDFFIDNYEDYIDLDNSDFFFNLIDIYKCKKFLNEKLIPNDGNTNVCLDFTFQCLYYLFGIKMTIGKLFDEPEKLFVIAIITDIKLELFNLNTIRIVIENHFKRYLQIGLKRK